MCSTALRGTDGLNPQIDAVYIASKFPQHRNNQAMPEIFYQPIRRRAFLRTATLAAGAAVITWKQSPIFGAEFTTASSIHLALLSDTHIAADAEDENRGFKPTQNLQQVVSEVLESEPEAALLCGDGARLDGQVGDYEALKSLLAPLAARIPISMNLGNHDDRDNFLQVFQPAPSPEAKVQGKYVLIHEWPRLRFVLLDSLLYVNKTAGLLGVNQRNWLERYRLAGSMPHFVPAGSISPCAPSAETEAAMARRPP